MGEINFQGDTSPDGDDQNSGMEDELQRYIRLLETLFYAGLTLAKLHDPAEIGEETLNILEDLLGFRRGALVIYKDNGELFLLAHARMGMDDSTYLAELARVRGFFALKKGLTRWVAEHGEIVRLGDVRTDERYLCADPDIRSEMAVPLQIGGRTIGAINVESELPMRLAKKTNIC